MQSNKTERGQPILVEIGDRLLEVRYSLKTLKALDKPPNNIRVFDINGGIIAALQDPAKLSAFLYFGLHEKQPDITPEWVDENVEASMVFDILPQLVYAATGRRTDTPDRPNATGPSQTGSLSGPSEGTTSDLANATSGA